MSNAKEKTETDEEQVNPSLTVKTKPPCYVDEYGHFLQLTVKHGLAWPILEISYATKGVWEELPCY